MKTCLSCENRQIPCKLLSMLKYVSYFVSFIVNHVKLRKCTMSNKLMLHQTVITYKIACLCYHCHSSIAPSYVAECYIKSHCTPASLAPAHTPCLFSIDLHIVMQHLVIAHFLLLHLLSGTLVQMMSGVPHHCHHLSLV